LEKRYGRNKVWMERTWGNRERIGECPPKLTINRARPSDSTRNGTQRLRFSSSLSECEKKKKKEKENGEDTSTRRKKRKQQHAERHEHAYERKKKKRRERKEEEKRKGTNVDSKRSANGGWSLAGSGSMRMEWYGEEWGMEWEWLKRLEQETKQQTTSDRRGDPAAAAAVPLPLYCSALLCCPVRKR